MVPGSRCLHNEPSRDKETKNILSEIVESTFTFDESDYEGVKLNVDSSLLSLCRPTMTFCGDSSSMGGSFTCIQARLSARSAHLWLSGSGSGPVFSLAQEK